MSSQTLLPRAQSRRDTLTRIARHPSTPSWQKNESARIPVAPPCAEPTSLTAPERASALTPSERETLYAEFQPLVRRLMRHYGTDAELREDLIGEIYFRFCALLDVYDPTRGIPLRPYLVRQLTASVYTYARHQWRRRHRELCQDMGYDTPCGAEQTQEWDNSLVLEQVKDSLPGAFAQISQRQRNVVIWRYYDGCSFEEIAERLEVRVTTVRSILRHGLNNLRRRLEASEIYYP